MAITYILVVLFRDNYFRRFLRLIKGGGRALCVWVRGGVYYLVKIVVEKLLYNDRGDIKLH